MAERGEPEDVPLERLQLNLSNPRFEDMDGRDEAIVSLLQNEQIVELARDIVDLGGINPLERLAVFPLEGSGDGHDLQYTTAEGNRRLCALILIDDPEAVPADMPNRARYVRTFNGLSTKIDPIEMVPCQVFEEIDETRPWLERLHNGARDGTGRRRWSPEQQARNTSNRTNRGATQLRDLGISLDIINADALARTTTTQQRFISNMRFRQAMGLVRLETGLLERTSCWSDFVIMLTKFLEDVADGTVNSRSHNRREDIDAYAQSLEELDGLERRNVPQGPLEQREDENGDDGESEDQDQNETDDEDVDDDEEDASGDGKEDEGGRPRRRTAIGKDDEILASLHRLGNDKLIDLYTSLAAVRAPQHSLLAVIGCWSFFEVLTRAHGRGNNTEFKGYINGIVGRLGVDQPEKAARNLSLDWIQNGGNVTKHDWQAAGYDHKQLFNAFDALKPVIVALADDLADRRI